jgi:hypothetical protein
MRKILLLTLVTAMLRAHGQEERRVLPDFAVMQYAGSIGYFSGGFGYNVFKSKARFSMHYGYIPLNRGGELQVVAAKLIFIPASITVWNRVKMNPVDVGIMGSYHYGDKMEARWPEGVYPKGYYWWYPALRAHLLMESSVTYEFKKGQRFTSVTGYVEWNTNELYFVSFVQNLRAVRLEDIVKVGTGVRLRF